MFRIFEGMFKVSDNEYNIVTSTEVSGGKRAIDVLMHTAGIPAEEQLACVQIRRTSRYDVLTSWQDLEFDSKDIENSVEVIEQIASDRIQVHQNGIYLIYTDIEIDRGGTRDISQRVRKNDASVLAGSERFIESNHDEVGGEISKLFLASLEAGDYVTPQIMASGTGIDLETQCVFIIIKLQGIKGATGDIGSGSSLTIQDEGISVANTPHGILDFFGFILSDEGGGRVRVSNEPAYSWMLMGACRNIGSSESIYADYGRSGNNAGVTMISDGEIMGSSITSENARTAGEMRLQVLINGVAQTDLAYISRLDATNTIKNHLVFTTPLQYDAGDTITMRCYEESSFSPNTTEANVSLFMRDR